MEYYPLSLGDVSPGDGFTRIALPLSWKRLPEGRHTGGPFSDGREVWKPLDALPGPDVGHRVRTLEDEILEDMYGATPSLFPRIWRVEERRGRRFLVRPHLRVAPASYPAEQITLQQTMVVEQMVRVCNERWWWIGDDLNVAFDPHGQPVLLDLSNAQRVNPSTAQGCERPKEEDRFEEWAKVVARQSSLVALRCAARHLVLSIRWTSTEWRLGWADPRRWVYAAFQIMPPALDLCPDCRVCPVDEERLGVRAWCVAPGPLDDDVVKMYGLQLGWSPLCYKDASQSGVRAATL